MTAFAIGHDRNILDRKPMDAFRHYVALVLVIFMPPVLLYWCLLHPWVVFWRRFSPAISMTMLWSAVLLLMAGLFLLRNHFLSQDYGLNPFLFAAGVVCMSTSAWLRRKIGAKMKLRTLAGLPEVAPDRHPQRLITDGLYARVRHPRYLQLLLGLLGWSLIANHPASYVACVLWIPGIWLIVVLEEKELRRRFGREYDEYCLRVPRFMPRRMTMQMSESSNLMGDK